MGRPRQDQFQGALIGCAVGDALGAPLEGWSRERIGELPSVTDHYRPLARGKEGLRYPSGQYTDDTQLTMAIARSLVACQGVDGADIAREFAALWRTRPKSSVQVPVADRAVRRLIEGVRWQDAAVARRPAAQRRGDARSPRSGCGTVTGCTGSPTMWLRRASSRIAIRLRSTPLWRSRRRLRMPPLRKRDRDATLLGRDGRVGPEPRLRRTHRGARRLARIVGTGSAWTRSPTRANVLGSHGFGIPALAEPTVLASLYAFLRSPRHYVATIDCALRIGG